MQIIIVSRIDGRHRGGIRHPLGAKTYESENLTVAQLRDIVLDPTMVVVIGAQITDDTIVELLADLAEDRPEYDASLLSVDDLLVGADASRPDEYVTLGQGLMDPLTDEPVTTTYQPHDTPMSVRPATLDTPDVSAGTEATQTDQPITASDPAMDLTPKKRGRAAKGEV